MSDEQTHSPLEDLFSDNLPDAEQRQQVGYGDSAEAGASSSPDGLSPAALFSSEGPVRPVADHRVPPEVPVDLSQSASQIGALQTGADEPEPVPGPQSHLRIEEAATKPLELDRGDLVVDAKHQIAEQRDRILDILLAGATLGGGLTVLVLVLNGIQRRERLLSYIPFVISYALVVAAYVLRRAPRRWRVGTLIGVSYAVALLSAWQNGAVSTAPWYLLAIPLLFFVLVGVRAGVISGVANSVLYVVIASAFHFGWLRAQSLIALEASLSQFAIVGITFVLITTIMIVVQVLFARAQRETRHSLEVQGRALAEAHAQSAQRHQDLERANATLRRHAQHFDLSIEIGRVAAMGLTVEEFVEQAVALILDRVGAHYVGLFMLNEERTRAHLEAVAGVGWEVFSPRQRRMAIDDDVLLRQCVGSARPRVLLGIDHIRSLSQDGSGSLVVLETTQSALALPLISRGRVFGVLTVQSRSPAAFHNEDLVSLKGVANQIATAISNTQLAQELQARIQAMEILQKYYVREEWEEFLEAHETVWYEYAQPGVPLLEGKPMPELGRALARPEPTMLDADGTTSPSALLSPISLRDQILGVLGFHQMDPEAEWTDDQIEMVAAVAQQLGLIIENSRLFAEAQSRAARERKVREIASRIRQSLDLDTVLRTAAREMGEALDLQDITVSLDTRDLEMREE